MRLFRPVGLYELVLIQNAGWRAFPPRLPEQPIFYPVLNLPYAEEIASKWNPTDPNSGYAGVVTQFDVDEATCRRYDTQIVGGKQHAELWIPAEDQAAFERAFLGPIEVVVAFVGDRIGEVVTGYAGPTGRLVEDELQALVDAVAQAALVGGPLTMAASESGKAGMK